MLLKVNIQSKIATRIQGECLKSFELDERGFQEILFNSLERFLPDDELILIMQSRRWREEPDLLAIDKNGSLYIFEIKAWESIQENLLQVLRYGQIYGSNTYEDIDRLFRKFHKSEKSLDEIHRVRFEVSLEREDYNRKQVFVLITNGIDHKTREAVRYWRKTGLDIRPWIYRVYRDNGDSMLLELNAFRTEDDPLEDVMEGFYILNTNYGNDPKDDDYMVRNKRAAAFFAPPKKKIEWLKEKDVVFLYRSGSGIVAVGKANGRLEKKAYQGAPEFPDEEYSMKLNQFIMLSTPISASEIKEIVGRNLVFRSTMFALDKESGQKIHAKILSDYR